MKDSSPYTHEIYTLSILSGFRLSNCFSHYIKPFRPISKTSFFIDRGSASSSNAVCRRSREDSREFFSRTYHLYGLSEPFERFLPFLLYPAHLQYNLFCFKNDSVSPHCKTVSSESIDYGNPFSLYYGTLFKDLNKIGSKLVNIFRFSVTFEFYNPKSRSVCNFFIQNTCLLYQSTK